MGFSIDPNVKGYINLGISLCGVVAGLGVAVFPDYVPPGVAKDVVQTAALIFALYGGINSAGNFLSSNKPGALAPPDPPSIVAARAVVALTADDSPAKVDAVKQAAYVAVQTRDPSKGPA
jgi:hypothetical protein